MDQQTPPQPPFQPYEAPPAETVPPPSRSRGKWAAIAVVVVILAGVAYAAVRVFSGVAGTADVLENKIPARSMFYATAYLDPGAGQKLNLEQLAGRFPALAGRDLGQTVDQGLEALTAESGLSFDRDIKPWLGSQIAVAVEPPRGVALVVDSTDDAKAVEGLSRAEASSAFGQDLTWTSQSYRGVELRIGSESAGSPSRVYAVTDHTVVVSSGIAAVEDVIDSIQGASANLGDDADYRATIDHLPKSVLGLAYVNLRDVSGLLASQVGVASGGATAAPAMATLAAPQVQPNPLRQLQAFRGFGMSLSAQSAGLQLDLAVAFDPAELTPQQRAALQDTGSPDGVLRAVPRQAFGFVALSNLKQILQGISGQAAQNPFVGAFIGRFHLQGVIDGLTGDAALEVGPGALGPASGALVVGTNDEAGMSKFLDQLATRLGPPTPRGPTEPTPAFDTEDYRGVTIHFRTEPQPGHPDVTPAYAVAGGFGIVATSPDEVKAVIDAEQGSNVTGSPTFQDARDQVGAGSQLLYVDIQSLLRRFRGQLSRAMGSSFSVVEPNLRPIKALVITGHSEQDASLGRLFILIR